MEALQNEVASLREELEACKFQANEYRSRALKAESALRTAQQHADLLAIQVKDYREELARIKAAAALAHRHSPPSSLVQSPADPPPLLPAIQGLSVSVLTASPPPLAPRQPSFISPRRLSLSPSRRSTSHASSSPLRTDSTSPSRENPSPSRHNNLQTAMSLPRPDSAPARPSLASPRLFFPSPRSLRPLADFAPGLPISPSAVPTASPGLSTPGTLLNNNPRTGHPLQTAPPATAEPLRPAVSTAGQVEWDRPSSTAGRWDQSPSIDRAGTSSPTADCVAQGIHHVRRNLSDVLPEPMRLHAQLSTNGEWADALGPVTSVPAPRDTASSPDLLRTEPGGPVRQGHLTANSVFRHIPGTASDTEAVVPHKLRVRDGPGVGGGASGHKTVVAPCRVANANPKLNVPPMADPARPRRGSDDAALLGQGWHACGNSSSAYSHREERHERGRDAACPASGSSPEAESESDRLGVRGSHVAAHHKDQLGRPHPHCRDGNHALGAPGTHRTSISPLPGPLHLPGLTVVSINGQFADGAVTDRNFRLPPNPNLPAHRGASKTETQSQLRQDVGVAPQAHDLGGWASEQEGCGPSGRPTARVRNSHGRDRQDVLTNDAGAAPPVRPVSSPSPSPVRRPAPPSQDTLAPREVVD